MDISIPYKACEKDMCADVGSMRSHVTVTWMSRDNVVVLTCVGYCHVFKSLNPIGRCTYHVMCSGFSIWGQFHWWRTITWEGDALQLVGLSHVISPAEM